MCTDAGYDRWRVVETDHGVWKWNMRLAAVVYNCIEQARNDRVLLFDSDAVPTRDVLHGLAVDDTVALHSEYPKFINCNIRFKLWRKRKEIQKIYELSSCMFLFRRAVPEAIDRDEMSKIHNGCDKLLSDSLQAAGCRCDSRRSTARTFLDKPSLLVPESQSMEGLYEYVQTGIAPRTWPRRPPAGPYEYVYLKIRMCGKRCKTAWRDAWRDMQRRHPVIRYMKKWAWMGRERWYRRGTQYAANNPESDAARSAARMRWQEWVYHGTFILTDAHDWNEGAGFSGAVLGRGGNRCPLTRAGPDPAGSRRLPQADRHGCTA